MGAANRGVPPSTASCERSLFIGFWGRLPEQPQTSPAASRRTRRVITRRSPIFLIIRHLPAMRIVQCEMILKSISFPMQDDPEIGILPRCEVDADSDEEYGSADAGSDL